MEKIQVSAHLKIHEGKLKEFKQFAKDCLATVKEKDNGTLQYDWFFNLDQTECFVIETYANSAAVLEHLANLGGLLGNLLSVVDLSLEVFGKPSKELLDATKGMDMKIHSYFQGL